ncbi:MAG: hypothetical protein AB2A00_35470 [Myxococcota bacterium]
METVLYALACVAIPAVWGVVMVYVFGRWAERRRQDSARDIPPIDYSI